MGLAGRGGGAEARPGGGSIAVGFITEPTAPGLLKYLKIFAACEGIRQVAVADATGRAFDPAGATLGRLAGGLRTFRDYREMLGAVRPELVLVSQEAHHAPEPIAAALEANCHVLADKPACARLEDFERLVRLADTKGRDLMLALATRVTPPAIKARELVQSGFLGRLYGTEMYWIADQTRLKSPEYHRSWFASRAKSGGGKLLYHGLHYLDLIRFITEAEITRVCGFCRNVGGEPIEVEDTAVVALGFRGGMVGTLNAGYYLDRGFQNLVTLWGSDGWLRFDQPAGTPLEWYSTLERAPRGIQRFEFSNTPDGYDLMVQAAVDSSRGLRRPFVTSGECLAALRVIFTAYRAAETGEAQAVV
jgi:predicted dehydrogenase